MANMIEANIFFVADDGLSAYTKVVRVEFEGTPDMFLAALEESNGHSFRLNDWSDPFRIVSIETLEGRSQS